MFKDELVCVQGYAIDALNMKWEESDSASAIDLNRFISTVVKANIDCEIIFTTQTKFC